MLTLIGTHRLANKVKVDHFTAELSWRLGQRTLHGKGHETLWWRVKADAALYWVCFWDSTGFFFYLERNPLWFHTPLVSTEESTILQVICSLPTSILISPIDSDVRGLDLKLVVLLRKVVEHLGGGGLWKCVRGWGLSCYSPDPVGVL